MRKLLFLFLAIAAPVFANDAYISNAGAGAQTGADCANAKPVSYYNSGSNWTAGTPTGVQIGPGTHVHLCGTIGTTVVNAGSGAIGNPVTVIWESGAKLSQPVCPATGCLNGNGKTDFVYDGGGTGNPFLGTFVPNGTIESTANGSTLANQVGASELANFDGASRITIKNMLLQNAYVHTVATDHAPSPPDPSASHATSVSTLTVTNSQIHDVLWAIYTGLSSSNVSVTYTEIYNADHNVAVGVTNQTTDTVLINHDLFHDWANWDTTATLCGGSSCYHHDGVHLYQVGNVGGIYKNVFISNNKFYGDQGVYNTAGIFNEGATVGTSMTAFNNVFLSPASRTWNNGMLCLTVGDGGAAKAYNNTLVTVSGEDHPLNKLQGTNSDFRNNVTVLSSPGSGGPGVNSIGSTTPTFVGGGLDYNFYGFTPSNATYFIACVSNCSFANFTQWKAFFAAGSGQEANSIVDSPSNFAVNTSTGIPGVGSTLFEKGTNLSALCTGNLTDLCTDFAGVARPAAPAKWSPGAFQFGGSISPVLSPPTNVTAVVQ
jgi:hypothetical protein